METVHVNIECRSTVWWMLVKLLLKVKAVKALQRLSSRTVILYRIYVNGKATGEVITIKEVFGDAFDEGVGGIKSSGAGAPPTAAPAQEIASNLKGTPPSGAYRKEGD